MESKQEEEDEPHEKLLSKQPPLLGVHAPLPRWRKKNCFSLRIPLGTSKQAPSETHTNVWNTGRPKMLPFPQCAPHKDKALSSHPKEMYKTAGLKVLCCLLLMSACQHFFAVDFHNMLFPSKYDEGGKGRPVEALARYSRLIQLYSLAKPFCDCGFPSIRNRSPVPPT